jgi:hypothetical protein
MPGIPPADALRGEALRLDEQQQQKARQDAEEHRQREECRQAVRQASEAIVRMLDAGNLSAQLPLASPQADIPPSVIDDLLRAAGALQNVGLGEQLQNIDHERFRANIFQRTRDGDRDAQRIAYEFGLALLAEALTDNRQGVMELASATRQSPSLWRAWTWVEILLRVLTGEMGAPRIDRAGNAPDTTPPETADPAGDQSGGGRSEADATGRDQGGAGGGEGETAGRAAGQSGTGHLEALSPLQYDILDALRALKATDPDKRATGPDIAGKVGGDTTDQSVKAPLADLKRRGLVDSRTGRNGGTWLTSPGLDCINSLRPKH